MKTLTFLVLSTLLTTSTTIRAHEFWLEAHPFYQKINQQTDITIHVGQDMKGDLQPNIPSWYSHFDVITNQGLKPVAGELGRDPAGYFESALEGTYAIGYQSTKNSVDLKQKKFSKYLKKKGLEKIIKRREELGESDKNGLEIYYRNVKTLIKIGHKKEVDFSSYDFGYPLNINPLQNPYDLTQGDELRVQLTFNQKPAANLLLQALIKNRPDFKFNVRTDKQGFATIPIEHKGVWLLHSVNMIRSNEDNIDWESFWGSITFEIS